MIYNQLNLQDNTFKSQGIGNDKSIYIKYNNKELHKIVGPVPLIDISHTVNNNSNNLPDTITTNINLTGKIFRHPSSGLLSGVDDDKSGPSTSGIFYAISGLKEEFTNCPYGKLEIMCNNTPLYTVSGLTINDMAFNRTEDNWIQTADYTISLSVTESLYGGDPSSYSGDPWERYVTNRVDSWTIEPLDDVFYTNLSYTVTQRSEYSNPGLNLTNNGNTKIPAPTVGASSPEHGSAQLTIKNMPRFKVNRRISAKGILPKESLNNDKLCFNTISVSDAQKPENITTRPYVYAKTWVEKIAKSGLQNSNSDNDNFIGFLQPNTRIFPCNHTRSTNVDVYTGSYEINDSWLVMTTGIPYTETYTIETSLDESFIKTVKIVGKIDGLSILPDTTVLHESGIFPTGIGNYGLVDANISLEYSKDVVDKDVPVFTINSLNSNPNNKYPRNQILSDKYTNAYSGWIHDIKPLLYRRASLAINPEQSTNNNNLGADRTVSYLPSYSQRPPIAPNNPIYSKENLLSIIPISTAEGHDPRKGSINYSYEFNNKSNIISGVIAENIVVSYDNPITTTTEVPVIGRALGPIIQKTGRTNPKKTINIEISIPAVTGILQTTLSHPSCPLHTGNFLWRTINRIVDATRPYSKEEFIPKNLAHNCGVAFRTQDSENWDPYQGKYSRTVAWTYAPTGVGCSNFRIH